MRVGDGAHHAGHPGGLRQRRGQRGVLGAADLARGARAARSRQPGRGRRDVRGQPRGGRLARSHALLQQCAQSVDALAGQRARGEDREPRQAVGSEQPAEVRDAGGAPGRVQSVGLVEHHEHHVAVLGERSQVVLVQHAVRVLLRVDDPDHQVGERDDPLDLGAVRQLHRVEVRQVQQDEPAGLAVAAVAARDREPVEQLVADVAPDGRGRRAGRRAAVARGREVGARQRIEDRRLAGARRAGERDHRRLDAEPEPPPGARDDRVRRVDESVVEPPARERRGLGERGEPRVERAGRAPHRARSCRPAAARLIAPAPAGSPPRGSSRPLELAHGRVELREVLGRR